MSYIWEDGEWAASLGPQGQDCWLSHQRIDTLARHHERGALRKELSKREGKVHVLQ